MKIKLLGPVTFEASIIEAGNTLDLSEKSALSLIADGLATEVASDAVGSIPPVGDGESDINAPSGEKDAENGVKIETEILDENTDPEIVSRIAMELDKRYKRDELADAAKAAGVEFPYDAKKNDIISAVLKVSKHNVLLKV